MSRTVAARPWRAYRWPALSLVTLLTYNTWALWRPVNGHAGIFDGYLSEFSASDQPHSLFFRGGDLITALIVLALGVRAVRLWGGQSRQARLGARSAPSRWWVPAWAGLLVFGVSTFLDAFFAMDCSPTLSEACRVAEESGRLSLVHYAHTYTSVGAQTGIVMSMVSTALALRRSPLRPGRGPGVRRFVLALSVVEVVALVVMMTMLVAHLPGLGYPQAWMVAAASLWFALVGFGVVAEPPEADPSTIVEVRRRGPSRTRTPA